MSNNSSDQEPSIEEILASIRQIISDDDDDKEKEVLESPVRHKSDDVLELTVDDLADQIEDSEPDIEMRDIEDEPEEEEYMDDDYEEEEEDLPPPPPRRKQMPSDILSSGTQSATLGSLSKLTRKMPIYSPRSYDGVTLEDIVRELLHPMLREWMDDNLPNMVERIVQKELEKLARRAFDD